MSVRAIAEIEITRIVRVTLFTFTICILFLVTACGEATSNKNVKLLSGKKSNANQENVISAYELHKILTDHFGFISIKLSDVQYTLPDNGKLTQLRSSDYCTQSSGTEREGWGIDDYAFAAMVFMRNYAFGIVYIPSTGGNKQVVNVLVNSSREVVYWDPLACQFYSGQLDSPEFILF